MRCEPNPQTGQIDVTWDQYAVSFDEHVGPLTVETLHRMLMPRGSTVHVRWNRSPSRAALHLIYDTLATVPNISINPSKAEALDAHYHWVTPTTTTTTIHQQQQEEDVPPTTSIIGTTGTVWHVDSLDDLTTGNYGGLMFNHVWAFRTMLHFPIEPYNRKHIQIANDLARMVGDMEPMAIVRSYSVASEPPVPLLLWFRMDEDQVLVMLQEYMHLCHPECRMWHWQLVPSDATLSFVAKGFAAAGIFPSLDQLFAAIVHPPAKLPPFAELETLSDRLRKDPARRLMFTLYDNGACVMWLCGQVFFYTRNHPDTADSDQPIEPVHVPTTLSELPPWVPQLLRDTVTVADKMEDQINMYLQLFIGASPSPTTEFLRKINWATLPLYWTPLFLKDVSVHVKKSQSREAQHRLVEILGQDETEETRNEAIAVIQSFTGTTVCKRPLVDSEEEDPKCEKPC